MIKRIEYKLGEIQKIYDKIEQIRKDQEEYLRDTNPDLGRRFGDLSYELWQNMQQLEKDRIVYNCLKGLCVHNRKT